MATAPTLISYTETASWVTGSASKSIASISWQIGDVLVAMAGAGWVVLDVPTNTGSGLAWVSQQSHVASTVCATQLATAVATAASSGVISIATDDPGVKFGFGVWVYRGSDGIGNSVEQYTTTKTVNLTPTGANGAIVWGVFDRSGQATHTITPTPTNTNELTQDGDYTIHVADLADQTSAGATAYGVSGGGSTGPYSIVALEIKGTAGGGGSPANWLPRRGSFGQDARLRRRSMIVPSLRDILLCERSKAA